MIFFCNIGCLKKVRCSKLKYLRMVQYNTAAFWDIINTTFIKLCVKFQPHISNETKVMNARIMMGRTGLGWQSTFLFKFVVYRLSPVWPIIYFTFITSVIFNIWGWNLTYSKIQDVCIMSVNITLLSSTILNIPIIFFLRHLVWFLEWGCTKFSVQFSLTILS